MITFTDICFHVQDICEINDDDDFSPLQQKACLLNLFLHIGEYFQSGRILIKHYAYVKFKSNK